MGLAQLISESEPSASVELIGLLKPCAAQLMDEIVAQRDLAAVESGEYYPGPVSCPLKALLETTAGLCAAHEVGRGRTVVVEPGVPTDSIVTERSLLTRVIGNMIKNALEAEPVGAVVKVGAERLEGGLYTLWVRNPTVMPRHVQLQIFQRSFTTKGSGRGLGTYSMKLLAERFLNGKVSFTSVAGTGTEFRITIPASTDV